MGRFFRFLIVLLILGGGAYALFRWYQQSSAAPASSFRTVAVKRGDILATIGATGTLEPEEIVDVGAQVAGQIKTLGKDPGGKLVDYNSEVEQNLVLAEIDDSLYQADLNQSKAQVESALANVVKAEADVKQFQAKLLQAQRDWDRAQKTDLNVLSPADRDAFQAAFESAKANVDSALAAVRLANAGVISANAGKDRAERNLSYCIIKSPVKGVIISRRVNVGQTVVSSLNAPSLFLIAKDLTKMEIWASVNEADIGSVKPEQDVTFTVDSVPGRTFHGKVGKVRLDAQTTQNVVTYTVEIQVENSDRALIPYLTASVQFEKEKRENVLMVPNVALRWMPSNAQQVSQETRDAMANDSGSGGGGGAGAGGGGGSGAGAGGAGGGGRRGAAGGSPTSKPAGAPVRSHGTVWVQDGAFAKPMKVRVGATDGTNTEVISADLKEGMLAITGEARPEDATADGKNPFMPQFGRGRGSGGGGGGAAAPRGR